MARAEKIESYSRGYDSLINALKEFPEEMWHFKPAPDKWNIHEILIHRILLKTIFCKYLTQRTQRKSKVRKGYCGIAITL